jgi:uncharacterized protein (DUF2132 family)
MQLLCLVNMKINILMSTSSATKSPDPLHGITLERMVKELQFKFGWEGLGYHIRINCFLNDPSLKSSLKFLRKTPWAREKVEKLYLDRIISENKYNSENTETEENNQNNNLV